MGAPVMLLELLKNQAFSDEHAAHLTNVSAGGRRRQSSSQSSMPPKPERPCLVGVGNDRNHGVWRRIHRALLCRTTDGLRVSEPHR